MSKDLDKFKRLILDYEQSFLNWLEMRHARFKIKKFDDYEIVNVIKNEDEVTYILQHETVHISVPIMLSSWDSAEILYDEISYVKPVSQSIIVWEKI